MKIPKITKLLRYRRPAWSATEAEFIHKYIDTIPGVYSDQYGNRLRVAQDSRTIISVHTDTVHWTPGIQQIQHNGTMVSLHPSELEKVRENKTAARPRHPWHKHGRKKDLLDFIPRHNGSNCLGADDTAGVYAALRMIDAGVKATFIFHRAEEIGGQGSQWLADKYHKWIGTFDRCIALDRRGTTDVITSQWGSRCCSDQFGLALADALGMGHKLAAGLFTDSANYAYLIPECSNLSVGYQAEHTELETLNVHYLEHLIDRLVKVDWEALPTSRDWVEDEREELRQLEQARLQKSELKKLELEQLDRLWGLDDYNAVALSQLRKDIRFDEIDIDGSEIDKEVTFDSQMDLDSGSWEGEDGQ